MSDVSVEHILLLQHHGLRILQVVQNIQKDL